MLKGQSLSTYDKLPSKCVSCRYRHEIAHDGQRIYILGGGTSWTSYPLDKVQMLPWITNLVHQFISQMLHDLFCLLEIIGLMKYKHVPVQIVLKLSNQTAYDNLHLMNEFSSEI